MCLFVALRSLEKPGHVRNCGIRRLEIALLQLLAYHTPGLHGRDVDQPRNLAKSVAVE